MNQAPCTFCRFVKYFAIGLFAISVIVLLFQIIALREKPAPVEDRSSVPPNLLAAPSAIIANQSEVALLLPDRVCDQTYIIERSVDGRTWIPVGTTTFGVYTHSDPMLKDCENNFVDGPNIPIEAVRGIFYRYRELPLGDAMGRESAPARVEFETTAEIDISPEEFTKFTASAPTSAAVRSETAELGFTVLVPKFYTSTSEFRSEGNTVRTARLDLEPEDRFRLLTEPGSSFPLTLTASRTPTMGFTLTPIIDYADMTTELTPVKQELRCRTQRFMELRYEQGGPERTAVHIRRFTFEQEADTVLFEFMYGAGDCHENQACRTEIESFKASNEALMCEILESIEFVKR